MNPFQSVNRRNTDAQTTISSSFSLVRSPATMFNSSNECYMTSSPTSPNVIFNRSHGNARYHPYSRPYCPSNELETYSFDNNNNALHHHAAAPMQSYETSGVSYEYNLPWTNPSSSTLETNEMTMEGTMPHSTTIGGTGKGRVRTLVEYRKSVSYIRRYSSLFQTSCFS